YSSSVSVAEIIARHRLRRFRLAGNRRQLPAPREQRHDRAERPVCEIGPVRQRRARGLRRRDAIRI
ncbi:MAG TPA: hypothetical protein VGF43_24345, partial [Dongiaceae bacterium]